MCLYCNQQYLLVYAKSHNYFTPPIAERESIYLKFAHIKLRFPDENGANDTHTHTYTIY